MINIDKEIQKLKDIEIEKQDKLENLEKLEKEKKNFLNFDKFNEFLEEEDSPFLYNFIMDIKNDKKTNSIPVFYNGCNEIKNFIEYISTYLVYNKVNIIQGFFDKILKILEKEISSNKVRLIILDNIYDKSIDFNKLAEILLNDKIKWHFILKSYTKNLPETFFMILNFKKRWQNNYKLYEFRHNFDIYDIKIYIENNKNNKIQNILVFEINYFHFFKIIFTNIFKIFEFFKEGINMNSSILHFNDIFSMHFDDRLFSIYINNNELTSKLQFYNSPVLRTELNNFITKYKKDFCTLN